MLGLLVFAERRALATLFFFLQLLDEFGHAKEVVHSLESHAFGFRYKEPRENEHAEASTAEEKEGTVAGSAHGSQHVGHGPGDNKVEEPLSCRTQRYIHSSQSSGWNLGYVDPAYRAPTPLEEAGEKVYANESDIACGRDDSFGAGG